MRNLITVEAITAITIGAGHHVMAGARVAVHERVAKALISSGRAKPISDAKVTPPAPPRPRVEHGLSHVPRNKAKAATGGESDAIGAATTGKASAGRSGASGVVPLESLPFPKLQTMVKDLGLRPASRTREGLIAALKAHRAAEQKAKEISNGERDGGSGSAGSDAGRVEDPAGDHD